MTTRPDFGMSASPLITGNDDHNHVPLHAQGRTRSYNVHAIEFTGSGSEYFRIWLVNLLLMLVTLGLYYPWAKVRKLRYFYGNTVIAGHPLDFHGNPRQMMRGFMLVAVFMGLYSFAGLLSPLADKVSFVMLLLIWPAMMRASLQFRLSNTSWRGLRFQFNGSLKEAYLVMIVPILAIIGLVVSGILLGGVAAATVEDDAAKSPAAALAFMPMLGIFALGPYVWWRMKRYQHSNYALGSLQTTFRASFGSMLGVFFKSGMVGVACMLVSLVAGGALIMAGAVAGVSGGGKDGFKAFMALLAPLIVLMILAGQLIQVPYFTSRMQNLVWTQTGNRLVRFKSALELKPLIWLTFKNWSLTLLTLGFYWPFAAVALTRAKLMAVTIHARQDPDELVAQSRKGNRDASGDLAADVLGFDFGL